MENIIFNLATLHRFGSSFYDFLALRKRFFVDALGWDIPHNDTVEMDQYDNPQAWYSIVLCDGRVVGGARAMATTAAWGKHSYMLRDARMGQLRDIPSTVVRGDIVDPKVWECTRLVISDDVCTQVERHRCLKLIVDGLSDVAAGAGAERLISLSPLALMRALRQMGFDARRIGAPYLNAGDGRRYAVLTMPAMRSKLSVPHVLNRAQAQTTHAPMA